MLNFKDFLTEDFYFQISLNKIESLIPEFTEHLLKVWIMPESRVYLHWKNEISNYAKQINTFADVKTKFGRIRKNLILKNIEKKLSLKRIENHLKDLKFDYKCDIMQSADFYTEKIKEFYDLFFTDIENDNFTKENLFQYGGF